LNLLVSLVPLWMTTVVSAQPSPWLVPAQGWQGAVGEPHLERRAIEMSRSFAIPQRTSPTWILRLAAAPGAGLATALVFNRCRRVTEPP
jgi:hypothetical protein